MIKWHIDLRKLSYKDSVHFLHRVLSVPFSSSFPLPPHRQQKIRIGESVLLKQIIQKFHLTTLFVPIPLRVPMSKMSSPSISLHESKKQRRNQKLDGCETSELSIY